MWEEMKCLQNAEENLTIWPVLEDGRKIIKYSLGVRKTAEQGLVRCRQVKTLQ